MHKHKRCNKKKSLAVMDLRLIGTRKCIFSSLLATKITGERGSVCACMIIFITNILSIINSL